LLSCVQYHLLRKPHKGLRHMKRLPGCHGWQGILAAWLPPEEKLQYKKVLKIIEVISFLSYKENITDY
jgi:hypothetical protein